MDQVIGFAAGVCRCPSVVCRLGRGMGRSVAVATSADRRLLGGRLVAAIQRIIAAMRLLTRLDPWLWRRPFEGASAHRYAGDERRGFGDLDARLLGAWSSDLRRATTLLDAGAGPGAFSAAAAARWPHLRVIALEPSHTYRPRLATLARAEAAAIAEVRPRPIDAIGAVAEAIPLADETVDVGVMLSVIRHVRDRQAALRELRRVIRPGGSCYLVELDPEAPRERVRRHTAPMRSVASRLAFAALILPSAPPAVAIAEAACDAGWRRADICPDLVQPVYTIRLSANR